MGSERYWRQARDVVLVKAVVHSHGNSIFIVISSNASHLAACTATAVVGRLLAMRTMLLVWRLVWFMVLMLLWFPSRTRTAVVWLYNPVIPIPSPLCRPVLLLILWAVLLRWLCGHVVRVCLVHWVRQRQ